MMRAFIGTIAVTVVFGVGTASVASAQDKAAIERGMKVYETHKCGMCHSVAGKGNQKGPLDGVGDKLTAEEIRQWLLSPDVMATKTKATRKPAMPNYTKLSKEDLDAIVAYMQSLKKK
jgi:mono/diheme cytochrome c family protein